MSQDSWASVSWEVQSHDEISLLHKHEVPYTTTPANALQNLEVWIPAPDSQTPDPSAVPTTKGLWVIYVHGGAWRDPLVTSESFNPTVKALASKHASIFSEVAGIASLNYSLSPRNAPDADPATQPAADSSSRKARHPDHIQDVLTGLAYLQAKFGFGNNYVLIGHSCGATLAFQVAMSHVKWEFSGKVAKPIAVVGLNGLYDMPNLISDPGEKHAQLAAIYETFTRSAFGDDKKDWESISPVSVGDWKAEWVEGKKAFLVQSPEDSLVPYRQLEGMKAKISASKADSLELRELEAGGDHNELWSQGDRLAEIVVEVVKSLA